MTCHHICRCGAELRCKTEPDQCAAGRNWECPNCEEAQFDAWINAQAYAQELRKPITLTRQEPTNEG